MKPRLLVLPFILPSCHAHSHITAIIINGTAYPGFNALDPTSNPPVLAAWSTNVDQDGWVGANDYAHSDIICHVNATAARGYVPARAGDKLSFRWNGWPESHHGPILTYLARCGGDGGAASSCSDVDKTALEFFEIDAMGLVDKHMTLHPYPTARGLWATDLLIYNNATFTVELPLSIRPGDYVLRTEIIALHYARMPALGPQHYPQCVNIKIEGGGDEEPEGLLATELYGGNSDVPGLTYDIHSDPLEDYQMPGPEMYAGARPSAIQIPVLVTAEATAPA
jgi:lytic cellulose monooxygenase (C1-hydroxylating)